MTRLARSATPSPPSTRAMSAATRSKPPPSPGAGSQPTPSRSRFRAWSGTRASSRSTPPWRAPTSMPNAGRRAGCRRAGLSISGDDADLNRAYAYALTSVGSYSDAITISSAPSSCARLTCRRISSWPAYTWPAMKTRAPLTSTTTSSPSTRATPAPCCASAWLTARSANSRARSASARTRCQRRNRPRSAIPTGLALLPRAPLRAIARRFRAVPRAR